MDKEQPDSTSWDTFWSEHRVQLPAVPDASRSWDRTYMKLFDTLTTPGKTKSVFEVGCAPGSYLAYLGRRLSCTVSGCEFSPVGVDLTQRNLAMAGVDARIHVGDFFALPPEHEGAYDFVYSLGFVEHFPDPAAAMTAHARLVAPGGMLLICVPNFRWINYAMQSRRLLLGHYFQTMVPAYHQRFAAQLNWPLQHVGYLGGFEPANIDMSTASKATWLMYNLMTRFALGRYVATHASRFWSGYLAAVYTRPR